MAEKVKKVEMKVEAKSQKGTGIKGSGDVWYNASKGVSFAPIQRGDKLLLSYVEGSGGGKFVVSYTKTDVAALPVAQPTVSQVTATVATGVVPPQAPVAVVAPAKTDDKMTRADWDAKDLKITKGGVAHDAATITAAMSAMKTDEEVKALFTSLFTHILKTVIG